MTIGASYGSFRQNCRQQEDQRKNEHHFSWVDAVPLERVCGTKLKVTSPKDSPEDRLVAVLQLHPISSKLVLTPKTMSPTHRGKKFIFEGMPNPMVQRICPFNSIPQDIRSIASAPYPPCYIGKSLYQRDDRDAHSLVDNQRLQMIDACLSSRSINTMQLKNMKCRFHSQRSFESCQSGCNARPVLSHQTGNTAPVYSNGPSRNRNTHKTSMHFGGDDMSSVESTRSRCIELKQQRFMVDMQIQILDQQEHIQQLVAMQLGGQSHLNQQHVAMKLGKQSKLYQQHPVQQQGDFPRSIYDSPLPPQPLQVAETTRRSASLEPQNGTAKSMRIPSGLTPNHSRQVIPSNPLENMLPQDDSCSTVNLCPQNDIVQSEEINNASATRSNKEDDDFVQLRSDNNEESIKLLFFNKEDNDFVPSRSNDKEDFIRLPSSCNSCEYGLHHETMTLHVKERKKGNHIKLNEKAEAKVNLPKQQIVMNTIPKQVDSAMSDASVNIVTKALSPQERIELAEIIEVSDLRISLEIPPHQRFGWYSGLTKEGKVAHGDGSICFNNGDTYTGNFTNGEMHGMSGVYTWAHGDSYSGSFWHNMRHGHGEYVTMNGRHYVGVYQYDKPNGYGVLYNKVGTEQGR